MAPTTSWLNRIAQQTIDHHPAADTQRLAVMDAASFGHYRAWLERVHGFEAAVERRVSGIPGLERAAAGAGTRVRRLHRDLVALGRTDDEIAALPLASIDARMLSEGFGWLLVIERQVLLAGLVRRHLASRLGPELSVACAYLETHPDGGAQVRDFGEQLADSIVRGRTRPDVILAAARDAFEAQHQWYLRPLALPVRAHVAA